MNSTTATTPSSCSAAAAVASNASPPIITGKVLQAKYPNAHRIMTELHFMRKLNEDLFQQLEDCRMALDELADEMPSSASALEGLRHLTDPDGGGGGGGGSRASGRSVVGTSAAVVTSHSRSAAQPTPPTIVPTALPLNTGGVPLATAVSTSGGGVGGGGGALGDEAIQKTKNRFLQFMDDALENLDRAKVGVITGVASGDGPPHNHMSRNYAQEYAVLRLKVMAAENAQKAIVMSKQRCDDLREELKTCRAVLRETQSKLERSDSEVVALRSALQQQVALQRSAACDDASSTMPQPSSVASKINTSHMTPDAPAPVEERVDELFSALFNSAVPPKGPVAPCLPSAKDHSAAASINFTQEVLRLSNALKDSTAATAATFAEKERIASQVTVLELEVEGLRGAMQTLDADRRDLQEQLDQAVSRADDSERKRREELLHMANLKEQLQTAQATSASLEHCALEAREAKRALAVSQEQVASLQQSLGAATAALVSEQQRREESERETLALQRMINSSELLNGLDANDHHTMSSPVGSCSSGRHSHDVAAAASSTTTTTTTTSRKNDPLSVANDCDVLQEEVYRLRSAVKDLKRHERAERTKHDAIVLRLEKQTRMLRRGWKNTGQAMCDLQVRNALWETLSSMVANTGAIVTTHWPLTGGRSGVEEKCVQTTEEVPLPEASLAASNVTEARQDAPAATAATRSDSSLSQPATTLVASSLSTISTSQQFDVNEVTKLRAERRTLQQHILDLQEALRVYREEEVQRHPQQQPPVEDGNYLDSAPSSYVVDSASQVPSSSRRSSYVADADGDELSRPSAVSSPSSRSSQATTVFSSERSAAVASWTKTLVTPTSGVTAMPSPSSSLVGAAGARDKGAAAATPSNTTPRYTPPPAIAATTTTAINSSSSPAIASSPSSPSRPPPPTSQSSSTGGKIKGLFAAVKAKMIQPQYQHQTPAAAGGEELEVISRQQLHNVQRLLEMQLRENMDLRQKLDELEAQGKRNGMSLVHAGR